jgi:hypothetical protein
LLVFGPVVGIRFPSLTFLTLGKTGIRGIASPVMAWAMRRSHRRLGPRRGLHPPRRHRGHRFPEPLSSRPPWPGCHPLPCFRAPPATVRCCGLAVFSMRIGLRWTPPPVSRCLHPTARLLLTDGPTTGPMGEAYADTESAADTSEAMTAAKEVTGGSVAPRGQDEQEKPRC